MAGAASAAPAAAEGPLRVIVVSRERILRDSRAGRELRESEHEMGSAFQARIDEVQRVLESEETELARLRGTLDAEEFRRRAEDFDRRIRTARRRSQREAAELQQAFRTARETLNDALGPILLEVLRADGASIVLDAEHILIAAPEVNRTEEVIRLFDARVPTPVIALGPARPLLPEPGEPEEEPAPK